MFKETVISGCEVIFVRWRTYLRRRRRQVLKIKSICLVAAALLAVNFVFYVHSRLFAPPSEDMSGNQDSLLQRCLIHYKVDLVLAFKKALPQLPSDSESGHRQASLLTVFPALAQSQGRLADGEGLPDADPQGSSWSMLAARGSRQDPTSAVQGEGPLEGGSVPVKQTFFQKKIGSSMMVIYHTHTSEDYRPTAGASHTYNSEAGIVAVGRELQRQLAQSYGIGCVHSTAVHDTPVYSQSYLRSEKTINEILGQNPDVDVVLDIHRDAPCHDPDRSRKLTTTVIDGQEVARVYIVVGTDRSGLSHPAWRQNHEFALQLQGQLEKIAPDLSRGIKVSNSRYNQHVHPRSLLLEVGGDQNSLEEAIRAVEFVAQALVACLDAPH